MDSYWEGYEQVDKPVVTLNNWSVRGVLNINPYTAPEEIVNQMVTVLHGEVFGHPHHEDGKSVSTSEILASHGNMVETHNTVYELKEADVSYLLWCESKGLTFDPANPVTVK